MGREEVSIIDVSETDEVATDKIHGANYIPLGDIDSRLDEID
ncbi:hypothetical protein [Salicibibacter cibi]|nr:hypothetical protein [Salicibibacter cibi]